MNIDTFKQRKMAALSQREQMLVSIGTLNGIIQLCDEIIAELSKASNVPTE